jgi:hypothetical protein
MQGKQMQHFTHFRSFGADFGIVKQANKQLKKLKESKSLYDETESLGTLSEKLVASGASPRLAKTKLTANRGFYRENKKGLPDPLLQSPRENITSTVTILENTPELPTKDWSDIRKTGDTAASSTGYLGFRKDPYKGYGGMMEEPIPKEELFPNGGKYTRLQESTIKSRVSGKTKQLPLTSKKIDSLYNLYD